MKKKIISILGVAMAAMLAGCAGQPQQFVVQQPDEQKPQTVTFPNGTTFGGASGTQASSFADPPVTKIVGVASSTFRACSRNSARS